MDMKSGNYIDRERMLTLNLGLHWVANRIRGEEYWYWGPWSREALARLWIQETKKQE